MRARTVVGLLLSLSAAPLPAQVVMDDEWCDHRDWRDDKEVFCEVREQTLPSTRDPVSVNASPNGGITVRSWDRNEIRLQTKVEAFADTEAEAQELVNDVRIHVDGRVIEADGPSTGRRESWVVSYRLFVPRTTSLSLETTNGGIGIYGVTGRIEFDATNGGIHLEEVGGDVSGRTTNGGLNIELSGTEWEGSGMDVRTTNGGVRLTIPEDYSARLETGTTNGGLRIGFPITVQGRIDRRITTDLGNGGQLIRAVTTNGGVVIRRK